MCVLKIGRPRGSTFWHHPHPKMANADSDIKQRGIIGLANLGNTCYMNAAIQALRHSPELTMMCKKGGKLDEHLRDKESNPGKIALGYQDLIQSIWAGTGPAYVKPMGFFEQLRQVVAGGIYEDFIRRTPQDAHEFLVWLMDQLYMATQREVNIELRLPQTIDPMIVAAVKGWKAAFEKQYSPLTDLIFGMMRIQYTCGNCAAVHNRWETFNVLKVPLVKNKPLMDCIRAEFEEEEIEDYLCETCKQKSKTKKSASIWRLPKVLIVTLKRFTPFGTRDNQSLDYDGAPINLSDVFSKESQEVTRGKSYSLFGTVDHHGHHMGGHYTAQCFNPVWKRWHLYDDETAHEIQQPRFGVQTYVMMFR
jgi:ubiquitin carboxyl-terminal hydrolase 2/21